MNTKNNYIKGSLYVSLLAFIAFVAYILHINKEVLYTVHDRSEFLYGTPFFHTLLSKPFGLIQYVGAWLTQFFYEPVIGSSILAIIWILIFFVGIKAFRLQGGTTVFMLLPVAFLLTSVVDLGYWVYIYTFNGYYFSQSLGYLLMLLLLWAARNTPRQWHLVWYILGVVLYPLLGWYSLLFVVCLVFADKLSWKELFGIIMLLFAANIWRSQLYSNQKLENVMLAGLPQIENDVDSCGYLTLPFYLLGAMSILAPLCGRYLTMWYVPILSATAGIVFTLSFMYYDKVYIDEMRMVRYASDENWEEVLHIAEDTPKPSATIVMLKNIALMNEGGLLERSFKMGNLSYSFHNPDSIHVSLLEIVAPLAYYYYGIQNEAIRLSYECAVQSGFSPFYLKILARSTRATGEKVLEQRFTTLLHHHPFYRGWQPAPISKTVSELQSCYPDDLTGVENSESYVVNNLSRWYVSDDKLGSELSLFYSMMRNDSRRFWLSMRKFVKLHQDEAFPVHAQEAYILFMDKAPEEKRMMIPVSEEIYDRYKQFWAVLEGLLRSGVNQTEIQDRMSKEYGDTYWFYNIFGRKKY